MRKDRQSEWGRLNAGQSYGILAVDVDRALALAGLGKHEQALVQAIRERSWGTSARRKKRGDPWPDAAPCEVNLKELAGAVGAKWQRLYEARSWLSRARVVEVDGMTLALNKNADEWVDPATGRPLLGPKALVYAALARTRRTPVPPPEFPAEPGESQQPPITPEREHSSRQSVIVNHAQPLTGFTPEREHSSRQSVNGHYKERASEDFEIRETPPLAQEGGTRAGAGGPARHQPARDPDDQTRIREAISVLGDSLEAEPVSTWLVRNQNTPEILPIEGWRFVVAARAIVSARTPHHKRNKWAYFLAIARGASPAELEPPAAPPSPAEERRLRDDLLIRDAVAKLRAEGL